MISVVMATFNGGQYLQEQLQSIAEQSLKPDEIIICDDGSTDNTADIVYSMKKMSDIPMDFSVNKKHLGYSQNFRQAINKASGDIIFLCDQDDIWIKNKIKLCMDVFNKNRNVLSLSTDFYLMGETHDLSPLCARFLSGTIEEKSGGRSAGYFVTAPKRAALNKISWKKFIRHPKYPGMAMAFRKELWPGINAMDWGPGAAHDWMINQFAAAKGGMFYLNRKLVFYRQHRNNTVGLLKNEPQRKIVRARLEIIDGLIEGLNAVRMESPGRQRAIKRMLAFQKRREKLLRDRRIFCLLFYEISNLDCISVKSICGDLYALMKSREETVCAESGLL